MVGRGWPIFLIVAGLLVGCDVAGRKTAKSHPTTEPAVADATTQPSQAIAKASTEPALEPATSELMIDGKLVKFPTARLRVSQSDGHVIARLYTNDPKSALEDDYSGNSYDLKMRLDDITQPQQIYSANWQFSAPSREYVNAPFGIFLNGMKQQLQPFNATAHFMGTMLLVRIDLDGRFLAFDGSDPNVAPKMIYVKGSLLAPVEYKD